ncbi:MULTISPECIES: ABC transporter permease [unclassified Halanaerobium]|uniref:ABC transporter permease n=1 Tax=unclassified Halanaerobium TaxID=2641197 RepID=UPI000DF328BA|nr:MULTISPECIES: ABC transporter permease [unclassified Halanaerobium]RCW49919.1 peptide/nickel transport system permease protein [Halanaerobium sp. MA284_MarDTE_T2]RCW88562.1 peptide/nickel transport system permease protein [Halanaerobium sp. DL-01]
MSRYLIQRIIMMIPVLLLVTVLIFSLIHLTPGDPALMMLGQEASPEALEALRARMGLDRPLVVQYFSWLKNVVKGDLGTSIRDNRSVAEAIFKKIPITLELALLGILISIVIAIPAGIISAVKKGTVFDYSSTLIALGGISMPSFWVGILLIYLFAVQFKILPPSGYISPFEDLSQNLKLMIMPSLSLGIRMAAVTMRMMRSSLLNVLQSDYVRTAAAKGLPEFVVILKHAVRNSLISVVTVIGLQMSAFLGGAVITEQIFAIPGFGRLVVQSIFNRDFPMLQGSILIMAIMVIFVNLAVDITYSFLDPRISIGGGE